MRSVASLVSPAAGLILERRDRDRERRCMGSRVCENDDSPVHREFAFGVDDATSVESHFGWLCQVCADGGARDPGPRGFCAILGIDTEDTFFSRVAQGIADGDDCA